MYCFQAFYLKICIKSEIFNCPHRTQQFKVELNILEKIREGIILFNNPGMLEEWRGVGGWYNDNTEMLKIFYNSSKYYEGQFKQEMKSPEKA